MEEQTPYESAEQEGRQLDAFYFTAQDIVSLNGVLTFEDDQYRSRRACTHCSCHIFPGQKFMEVLKLTSGGSRYSAVCMKCMPIIIARYQQVAEDNITRIVGFLRQEHKLQEAINAGFQEQRGSAEVNEQDRR